MKRGRPNDKERKDLQEKLYWYYTHDISAETAAMQLKIDRKTAYKYYKKFSDNIQTITQKNFFTEIKTKIKQRLKSYDHIILELNLMLNTINEKINEEKYHPSLINQKLAVIKEIKHTMNEKSDLELKIPTENTLEDAIDEAISKREND